MECVNLRQRRLAKDSLSNIPRYLSWTRRAQLVSLVPLSNQPITVANCTKQLIRRLRPWK